MSRSPIDNIARVLRWPFLCVVFAYLALHALANLSGLDYLFHVKSGEHIVVNKVVSDKDVFSFTQEGKSWANHSWLYQVLVYGLHKNFGINGLFFLKIMLLGLSFFLLASIASEIEEWYISLPLVYYGLKISFYRFTLRPDHVSFLFFILFLLPFTFRIRKMLFVLPVIQCLWVNMHGFFFLGPVVLILYLLTGKIKNEEFDREFYNTVKLSLLLCVLACFINPHPIQTLFYPIKTAVGIFSGSQIIAYNTISELKSPIDIIPLNSPGFNFMILTSLSLLCFRKPDIFYMSLWAVTMMFSLNSVRNFYFFVPVGLIVFLDRYIQIKEYFPSRKGFEVVLKTAFISLAVFISITVGEKLIAYPKLGQSYLDLGAQEQVQIKSRFLGRDASKSPQKMLSFMKEHPLPQRMFNNFNLGAILISNFFPQRQVFIDGRSEFYGDEFLDFYYKVIKGDSRAFEEAVKQYRLEGLVIDHLRNAPPPVIKTAYQAGFKCVYFDTDGIILLKEEFINRHDSLRMSVINFQEYEVGKVDLIEDLKLFRPSVHGYYSMAVALRRLGFPIKCMELLKEVLKVSPDHYKSYRILAEIFFEAGEYEKAFLYCRRSLFFNASSAKSMKLLAHIYAKTGHMDDAQEVLKKVGINPKEFFKEYDKPENAENIHNEQNES